jgi:hypothetical protein
LGQRCWEEVWVSKWDQDEDEGEDDEDEDEDGKFRRQQVF